MTYYVDPIYFGCGLPLPVSYKWPHKTARTHMANFWIVTGKSGASQIFWVTTGYVAPAFSTRGQEHNAHTTYRILAV
jgi:hypothetical protein